MKRRNFLKIASASSFATLLGGLPIGVFQTNASPLMRAMSQDLTNDHVLVIVQLNGGNDGLNTIIPLEFYDNYFNARSNIAIPEADVLGLDGLSTTAGFHPAMDKMQQMYLEEKLGIIQSVGYPSPNLSHFRATDIWMSASNSDQVITSGWGGRFLDDAFPGFPDDYPNMDMPDPLAIQIGSIASLTCMGPVQNMAMSITDPTNFYDLLNGDTGPAPASNAGKELTFLRTSTQQTNQYAAQITAAADAVPTQYSGYPVGNRLADQLKIVARLIKGGLKTRIYMVSLGGFDTHALQTEAGSSTTGTHADLLGTVSEAIFAFQEDLSFLEIDNKVLGMTYSEFGRRIRSNASTGTDHGAAAPMFIFGTSAVKQMLGNNPTIATNVPSNANIPHQYDFRSVYYSILEQWFCLDPLTAASLFPPNINITLESLPIIDPQSCSGDNPGCCNLLLNAKVMLEGPYNSGTLMMDDDLRTGNYIPTEEPFASLGFTSVNNVGEETISDLSILNTNGNTAVVDWLFVELRSNADPNVVVATRSGLLLRDGSVVDVDGISSLTFNDLNEDTYYVAIRHRNHLSVRTANAVSLSASSATLVDFTSAATPVNGTAARKDINGTLVLWAGDANTNNQVDAADRSETWNNRNQTGYLDADVDMSGSVTASDRSITWNNRNKVGQ